MTCAQHAAMLIRWYILRALRRGLVPSHLLMFLVDTNGPQKVKNRSLAGIRPARPERQNGDHYQKHQLVTESRPAGLHPPDENRALPTSRNPLRTPDILKWLWDIAVRSDSRIPAVEADLGFAPVEGSITLPLPVHAESAPSGGRGQCTHYHAWP